MNEILKAIEEEKKKRQKAVNERKAWQKAHKCWYLGQDKKLCSD